MSQYTYPYGYGSYPGPPPSPSQQSQQPYGYQPAPQYPPPTYNQTYDPVAAGINLAASQNSFNYNANQIPGLGIGPPPVAPSFGAALDPNGRAQPPYPGVVPGLPTTQPSPTPFNGPPPHYAPSWATSATPNAPRVTQPPPRAPPVRETTSQPKLNDDIEEGELSEGQFEDLYEPRQPVEPNRPSNNQSKLLSTADPSQPASVVATPEAGFYGNDDVEGEMTAEKGGVAAADDRERSGSYSPFLSPREIRTENTTPQDADENGDGPSSPFLAPGQSAMLKAASNPQPSASQKNGEEPGHVFPGLQYASQQRPTAATVYQQPNSVAKPPSSAPQKSDTLTSLQEMKKEAQKAILRLWPLGVKFQHYVDEGFDEKVIKGLFGDLHLDMPKHVAEAPKVTGQESASGQVTAPTSRLPKPIDTQPPATIVKESSSKSDKMSQGEERKDRIARLLAAKAAKAPVANAKPTSPQENSATTGQVEHREQTAGTSTPPKSKPWGEKERLLQQKIAALQKSREAQAQKSAAAEPSQGVAEPRATGSGTGSSAQSLPTLDANNKKESAVQSNTIPGLLPPSAAQPNQNAAHRKRPVAADFVDYSSTVGPTKRPFGQDRSQSSLIIDVSDGSDDEEMDMDVDSPTDEPLNSRVGSFGQRGPLIRDFPPLTDTRPTRQFSSPFTISQTPPNGSINGRRRETELDLKERAIQEMRRKIAEAEAKRKAKQSPGSQTPQTSRTPELKEIDASRLPSAPQSSTDGPSAQLMSEILSARLSKKSDRLPSDQQGKAERRGRIVSFELPRIDDSLEDKIRRLNQLRDEEQRLKAEIDNELARKRLLTEELEHINTEPSDSASQPSGPSSAGSSANSQTGSAPVEQVPAALGTPPGTSDQGPEEQSDGASDISMDEDQSSRESSRGPASNIDAAQPQFDAMETLNVGVERESVAISVEPQSSKPPDADDGQRNLSSDLGMDDGASRDAPAPLLIAEQPSETRPEEAAEPDKTQADLEGARHDTSGESEAETLSPPQSTPASGHVSADEGTDMDSKAEQLDQISTVGQPREDAQEIEDAQVIDGLVAEIVSRPAPKSEHAFHPYSSPLRYFRAYRYHSDYPSSVVGGLKSLTYSNRIDPMKALCPYELAGQQCPTGCDFQHFSSILVPDDQILVELGRADDYIGDQKNRFIQGLRELLQELRAKKVKDFDAIARGIIDYRASFLGDKSKILPLEGVTL
ncbi:hypothetical protein B0T14DRAFT_559941 [Immersiella caudata]|uniref:Putative zinc-finger domain-containing protein n=1 Tax=Immersiella caudata TaxID=314043 RepID=A0AA40CCD3_9PEZI|nr:hypothetical protein B0T14DRAFT_559941 [Immersiella caudata]